MSIRASFGLAVPTKSPFRSFREKNPASLRISWRSRRPCTPRRRIHRIFRVASVLVIRYALRVGWEAYSAKPIPPFEQPVIRTTFDLAPVPDILMRLSDPKCYGLNALYKGGAKYDWSNRVLDGPARVRMWIRGREVDERLGHVSSERARRSDSK